MLVPSSYFLLKLLIAELLVSIQLDSLGWLIKESLLDVEVPPANSYLLKDSDVAVIGRNHNGLGRVRGMAHYFDEQTEFLSVRPCFFSKGK